MLHCIQLNTRDFGLRVPVIFNNDSNNNADACEYGNEPSGSIKCGEFLD